MSREAASVVRAVGEIVGMAGLLVLLMSEARDTLSRLALIGGFLTFVVARSRSATSTPNGNGPNGTERVVTKRASLLTWAS